MCASGAPTVATKPVRRSSSRRSHAGDVLQVRLAGGGGYGDARERDPEAVLADVLEEKMSVEHARDAYGVVVPGAPPGVDVAATARRRDSS